MVCSGIKATKFYSFLSKELLLFFFLGTLSKELGGASNVGFSGWDCHNFLQTKRKEIMEVGDG